MTRCLRFVHNLIMNRLHAYKQKGLTLLSFFPIIRYTRESQLQLRNFPLEFDVCRLIEKYVYENLVQLKWGWILGKLNEGNELTS